MLLSDLLGNLKRAGLFAGLAAVLAAAGAAQAAPVSLPPVGGADIAGQVTSTQGPEAGVWVIAETADLPTRFARIVVTDGEGRYLVPDLPPARYHLWVRGYGLADSPQVDSGRGQRVDLTARIAASPAQAALVYPAAYWYAMMRLPTDEEVAHVAGGRNGYLMFIKNMGCIGCHQLGNLATRTLPPGLGSFANSRDAWVRRISSGQAGRDMLAIAMGSLQGVPIKYLADWTRPGGAGRAAGRSPAAAGRDRAQCGGHRV
jgi:hypothetical protein